MNKIFKISFLFVFLLLLSSVATASLETGLQVYYDGSDYLDKSGNNITLTNIGTTIVANNYTFDGTNDYMTIPASITNNLNEGTLCLNTAFTDETTGYNIFGKNAAAFRSQYSTSLDDVYLQVNSETSMYSIEDLDWTNEIHECFIWDGTNKYIYINGVESISAATTANSPASGDLYIGHNSVNTNELYKGNMNNIVIYNRALNNTEVLELYNAGGNPLPATSSDEVYESTTVVKQIGTATFVNPTTIISSEFEVPINNTPLYGGYSFEVTTANTNTLYCSLNIDGVSFANVTRTNVAGTRGNVFIQTPLFYPTNETNYTQELVCERLSGAGQITISEATGIGHFLVDANDVIVPHNETNFDSDVTSGSSYTLLDSFNITTGDQVSSEFEHSIVIEGMLQFNNDHTSLEQLGVYATINDAYNCSFNVRDTGASASGSVSYDCIQENVTADTLYTIDIYGNGTNANYVGNFIAKDLFISENEIAGGTGILKGVTFNGSTDTKLFNLTGGNLNHPLANVFQKVSYSVLTDVDTEVSFYIKLINGTSYTTRNFTRGFDAGVVGFLIGHDILEDIPQDDYQIEFWGNCGTVGANCEIVGGSSLGYITDVREPILNSFSVTAKNEWDNNTINSFSVTYNEGTFTTTTGILQIFEDLYNIRDDGIISYYPFTGNANDAFGTNDGTVTGATLTTDRFNNTNSAYLFTDGDEISLGDVSEMEGIEELSVAFWLNTNNVSKTQGFVTKGTYYTATSSWAVAYSDSGRLRASVSNSQYRWANANLQPNTDYFITWTYSTESQESNLYINGIELEGGADAGTFITIPDTTQIVRIGKDSGGDSTNGILDDVIILNRELTQDEITTLYNEGFKNTTLNLTVSSTDYFNEYYNNHAVSSNLEAYLHQSEIKFNATEIVTLAALSGVNFTIDGRTLDQFNLSVGNYNVTASKTGYYDKVTEITVSALDNTTLTITGLYDSIVNLTATDKVNGSSITNFSTTVSYSGYSFSESYNTTTGVLEIPLKSSLNYTFYSTGDETHSFATDYIFPNIGLNNYNIELYKLNSVHITFYDEADNSIVNTVTVFADIISQDFDYAVQLNTTTGYINDTIVAPSEYLIRYSGENFTERFYYFTLEPGSFNELSLYMIQNTSSQDIQVRVVDQDDSIVIGAFVKALKYNVETNAYELQEVAQTSNNGVATLHLSTEEQFYKFQVEYEGDTKITTNPDYIRSSQITLQINLGVDAGNSYFEYEGIDSSLSFNNATNNFKLTYNALDGITSGFRLYVYEYIGGDKVLLGSAASESASGTLLVPITPQNGSYYIADAFYDEDKYLNSATYGLPDTESLGNLGLLLQILITLVFMTAAVWEISLMPIALTISILLGRIVHLNMLNYEGIWVMIVLSIIIAWFIKRFR